MYSRLELTLRLASKMEERLNRPSKRTGRPKAYYAKRAIEEFLDEQEDYLIAVARLEENLPPIPLAEVVKRLAWPGPLTSNLAPSPNSRSWTPTHRSGLSVFFGSVSRERAIRAGTESLRRALKWVSGDIESESTVVCQIEDDSQTV